MDDNGIGLFVRLLGSGQCTALNAVPRVNCGILVSDLTNGQPLEATPSRASFIIVNMARRPLFSPPIR